MSELPRPLFAPDPRQVQPAAWRQQAPALAVRALFAADPATEEAARQAAQAERRRALAVAAEASRAQMQAEGALRAGFEAGYSRGKNAATAEFSGRLQEIAASLLAVVELRAQAQVDGERQVVDLALHMAEQLLTSDQQGRRAFTEKMVREALALLHEAEHITLRLAASDLAALVASRPELAAQSHVTLVEDNQIALGGVVADCALGRVDATLDARLATMRGRLADESA